MKVLPPNKNVMKKQTDNGDWMSSSSATVLTLFSGVPPPSVMLMSPVTTACDNTNSVMLATSSSSSPSPPFNPSKKPTRIQEMERILRDDDRELLSDKQRPFQHLKPKTLLVSTIRVVMKQAAECLAHFLSDKLEQENEMDDLIEKGQITIFQADQRTQAWEEKEWQILIQTFPHKAWTALWKFHATTLLCRLYEYIASKYVSTKTLDKLTLDVFAASKRTSKACGHERMPTFQTTFYTCLWANAILYLADFSVSEIVLSVTWYRYQRRGKRQEALLKAAKKEETKDDEIEKKKDETSKSITTTPHASSSSLSKQSAHLLVCRTVGWVAASAGGAVGTLIYPGWGTLMGVNMGDSMVASVMEE